VVKKPEEGFQHQRIQGSMFKNKKYKNKNEQEEQEQEAGFRY
jgi:hypothetical protein